MEWIFWVDLFIVPHLKTESCPTKTNYSPREAYALGIIREGLSSLSLFHTNFLNWVPCYSSGIHLPPGILPSYYIPSQNLAWMLVTSRLNCCEALHKSSPLQRVVWRVQLVHNAATRLVSEIRSYTSSKCPAVAANQQPNYFQQCTVNVKDCSSSETT